MISGSGLRNEPTLTLLLDHESYCWGRIILGLLVYHILPTYFSEPVLVHWGGNPPVV